MGDEWGRCGKEGRGKRKDVDMNREGLGQETRVDDGERNERRGRGKMYAWIGMQEDKGGEEGDVGGRKRDEHL